MHRDMAKSFIYLLLYPMVGVREIHDTLHDHIPHECNSVFIYKSNLRLFASLFF